MNTTIRKANKQDYPAILALIKELATFVKAPDKVTNSVELMNKEDEHFNCLVAENENKDIVALALYFYAYFTWTGKSLYLDDLYVKEKYRGQKIGSQLLEEIFKIAKQENCKRVRWQVIEWNKPALEFYKKCGAQIDKEIANCDFDLKAIQQFKI